MTAEQSPLLIIGGPDTGKTHFATVLLSQWEAGLGRMRLLSRPESLRPFEEPRYRLAEGRLAAHTAMGTYAEVFLDVEVPGGRRSRILFPEYGGERLPAILRTRQLPQDWRERLRASSQWLLMLRPSKARRYEDFLDKMRMIQHREGEAPSGKHLDIPIPPDQWDDGAFWTELLQVLLEGGDCSLVEPLAAPRLAIVLSCWDELPQEHQAARPQDVFAHYFPMLAQFIAANWQTGAYTTWGISALGRALKEDIPDEDYMDLGPAEQGWAVDSSGTRVPHLDAPLVWLLSRDA